MSEKLSAIDITKSLREKLRYRHADGGWIYLEEVRNETGYNAKHHCDALAFGCWPSRGYELHGFEIKASRSDWLKDLNNPAKADAIAKYCDYWWIVAPKGIVKVSELPPQWGLLNEQSNGSKLTKVHAAERRDPTPLDRGFIAAFLNRYRQSAYQMSEKERADTEQRGYERGLSAAKDHVEGIDLQKIRQIRQNADELEKRTGISLDGWLMRRDLDDFVAFRKRHRATADVRHSISHTLVNLNTLRKDLDDLLKSVQSAETST